MPKETLKNISPREYQQSIYETCKDKNCLVVLPTGIGKTLIALMLAINRQKSFPGSKCLFLAPTRPLAQQHLDYFKKHLPELFAQLELFTGKVNAKKRQELWQRADIVFSTPQCIGNDLKNNLYNLEDISLLVEDECHRCLKSYAYVYVVQKYKEQAKNPRILGLTASPGADIATINKISKNLGIEAIELRTRDSGDVKEYLQELNFRIIRLEFPGGFAEIRNLLKSIMDKKIEELKKRRLLFGMPTKVNLLETQKRIMGQIGSGNRNFNLLAGASACAQAVKLQHALELIETQTLYSFHEYLQGIFEQAEKKLSKAAVRIVNSAEFMQAYAKLTELLAKKIEHPKLIKLKELTCAEIKKNPKTKMIVFSQYRSTVARICKELNQIPGIMAKVFVGQAKKSAGYGEERKETGLSQDEQREIIRQFSKGDINILCSTSIGEEGLDIPEVNSVIFYEPVPSAIRKIQRAGRTARLMKGSLIILLTEKTRDESYYYAAFHKEKKMYRAIQSVKENLEFNSKINSPGKSEGKKQKTLF